MFKMKTLGEMIYVLIVGLVVFVFVYGYVENIVKLMGADILTGTGIVRIIGIFVPPVGAIAGWN